MYIHNWYTHHSVQRAEARASKSCSLSHARAINKSSSQNEPPLRGFLILTHTHGLHVSALLWVCCLGLPLWLEVSKAPAVQIQQLQAVRLCGACRHEGQPDIAGTAWPLWVCWVPTVTKVHQQHLHSTHTSYTSMA